MNYEQFNESIGRFCVTAQKLLKRITVLFFDWIFDYYYWRNQRAENAERQHITEAHKDGLPDRQLLPLERRILDLSKTALEKLRSCALCHKNDEQEYFIRYGDSLDAHEVHVDCGSEHNDAMKVDPSTRWIGESDEQYTTRCRRLRMLQEDEADFT